MVDKSQKDIKEKEGLLTALAVLSLPVAGGLSEILRAYAAEVTDKKKGDD